MTDDREYPERPWIGIGVIVFKDDRVLMIRRGKPPRAGQWSLPGGAQQLGETVFEAARREVAEETGLDVEPQGIVTVVDSVIRDGGARVRYHYTLVEVLAEWHAGEPTPGDDAEHAEWLDMTTIRQLDLWSETVRVIELAHGMRSPPP
jgi:ADP-ribose pyrophosphatase YjhB (NUDIX family)